MTYGTFGMQGAILSNGILIAADNAAKDELDKLKELTNDLKERWMILMKTLPLKITI